MHPRDLLDLLKPEWTGDQWHLTAHRALCLGPPDGKHMSGGAQSAAIVALLEAETGRPLIQLAGQFLASPASGETASIAIDAMQSGRAISLASASIARGANRSAVFSASLGERPDAGSFNWEAAPVAPPPQECAPLPFVRSDPGDLHTHLDIRMAHDPRAQVDGRLLFWVRWDDTAIVPAAFLALIADYLPEAIHFNIGRPAGAVSLDNSLRITGRAATPWLLCETRLQAVANGLFHGRMSIFAQNGNLLALASQSGVVRLI
jgi:acyl-CoA thioesterase II